jgi:hypothetical protein
VLAPNVANQDTKRGRQVATATVITTSSGHERLQATLLEGVKPSFERRHRITAGRVAARRTYALLARAAQKRAAFTMVEGGERNLANEAVAEDRHLLGVILRGQLIHRISFGAVDCPADPR